MHPLMLKAVIDACRARITEGDCPTTKAIPVEQLEEAVVQLAAPVPAGNPAWEWIKTARKDAAPVPAREWIPVGRALPEYDTAVLIYPIEQHKTVARIPRVTWPQVGELTKGGGWFSKTYGGLGSTGAIVGYWMPLPPPPAADK